MTKEEEERDVRPANSNVKIIKLWGWFLLRLKVQFLPGPCPEVLCLCEVEGEGQSLVGLCGPC